MNIALLQADSESLEMARAIVASGQHSIVAICQPSVATEHCARLFPAAEITDSWESLLHAGSVDVVLVSRGAHRDERADQLRKLAQAGVGMLVVHPGCEAIVAEIDMIRHDTGCVVFAWQPDAFHPAVLRLASLVGSQVSSTVGTVSRLVFERQLVRADRQSVLVQLARDALLLSRITGGIAKVGAMSAASNDDSYASLSVHMTCSNGMLATWSASCSQEDPAGRVTLVGSARQATLVLSPDYTHWQLDLGNGAESYAEADPVGDALHSLQDALTGKQVWPAWEDACRAIEVAEAAEQSLRRGRAIDLHNVALTEENTFKSLMAAGGCLLLSLCLLVLLAVAVVEGLGLPLREHVIWRLWPAMLLGVFIAFLLMQLLKLVFPQPDNR